MGCKLLEIMADGWYVHRFEAFLKKVDAQAVTVGCPSNGRRAYSISTLPAPPLKQAPAGMPAPSSPWSAVLPRTPHRPTVLPSLA